MGYGLHAVGAILLIVFVLSIVGIFHSTAWALTLWLELLYPFLKWGGILSVFLYLTELSLRIAWHSRHAERGKLSFAMILMIITMLFLRWMANRPIADELFEIKLDDGIILQSGGYSCVPATMANVLGTFGISVTEKTLAADMGTTMAGTTSGRVAFSLLKYDLHSRRVNVSSITEVQPPAALIVDHQATGPESHMVAFISMQGDRAEIWDPLEGHVIMTPEKLSAVWHGKALEIYR